MRVHALIQMLHTHIKLINFIANLLANHTFYFLDTRCII